ncbi:MAG: hypothetical protein WBC93_14780 [Sulfitobacter sp.]
MKPNFALSLSIEGIRLLHRAAGGWRVVGQHGLDVDDLSGELAMLRKTASSLEPGGVRCKVIIPNDQIRYLTIETDGLNETARDVAARAALEQATPYAVDDLAYDTSPDGTKTHIAAVALETLVEAEAFATEHRFHPVSFVAAPGDAPFLGEPFFGPSTHAATLLGEDDSVEPDGIAVVVIGDVTVPSGPVVSDDDAPTGLINDPALPTEQETDAEDEAPAAPDDSADDLGVEDALPKPEPPKKPRPEKETPALTFRPSRQAPVPKKEFAPVLPLKEGKPDEPADVKELDAAADAIFTPSGHSGKKSGAPQIEGFASKRADPKPTAALGAAVRDREILVPVDPVLPKPPTDKIPPAPPMALQPELATPSVPVVPKPTPKPDAAQKAGFLSRRKPQPAKTPVEAKNQRPEPTATPENAEVSSPRSETERMTIFGARKAEVIGGKPKYLGLLLTVALLLLMATIAAWASVYLGDGLARLFGREPARTFAEVPEVAAPEPVIPQASEPADIITASVDPSLTDEDDAVLDALRAPIEPVEPEPLTEDEIAAQYAVTGIWPLPPEVSQAPSQTSIEDLYITSIDPISLTQDAIALPDIAAQSTDREIAVMSSPAPAGTIFTLDQRGLVVPTASGAINPDGIAVFLGKPPLVPPATFVRLQTGPEADVPTGQPDPALAKTRPKTRPGGLIENNERATLDGLTRTELAGLRPRVRPQSAQQAAQQASLASLAQPAIDNAVMSILEAQQQPEPQVDPLAGATARAVAASVRPDPRPSNFAKIVQRAVRAAPKEETRVASAASVAPRTVQPSIPTTASVAREATINNALNLRKVNLIGVYGKPSNRRALVRLANGRYRKVQVGDRIDGGRVSAIGDSELSYKKGNRNLVLSMPKS